MLQILDAMDYDFEHRKKAMKAIQKRVDDTDEDFSALTYEIRLGKHPEYGELLWITIYPMTKTDMRC